MSNADEMDPCSTRAAYLLSRIASALSCPVEAFSTPALDQIAQTAELSPLWLTIKHEQDRMKVLSIVRNVAPTIAMAIFLNQRAPIVCVGGDSRRVMEMFH
jgi:hypothetical protein